MKFSTRTRYGLRFLLCLAALPPGEHLNLHQVAQREKISPGYLEQIVRMLRPAGILNATRGNGGGYNLKKCPTQINLEEIFMCLEGNISPVHCVSDLEACTATQTCAARKFWNDLDQHIRNFLRNRTLADILPAETDGKKCFKGIS